MASAASLLTTGVFASEAGQRLLHILDLMTDRGFRALFDKCSADLTGTYYQTGLRRVHLWSADVIREDVDHVRGQCPDLEETYEACFMQHIRDRFRDRQRPTARCPPVADFTRAFLVAMGRNEQLRSGQYFARPDVVYTRMACMDAARSAFYELSNSEHVRVELASVRAPCVRWRTRPPSIER